jgi:methylmalonyl-CoA/ethylmalonyl-CoA epimerase
MMKIDHFGYVVENIEDSISHFIHDYNYSLITPSIYDPEQHVKLALLSSGSHFVEFIQPIDETSPSFAFLQKGGGLHHICYKVSSIEESILQLKKSKHLLFKTPVAAVLFGGKKVAFLYHKKTKQIIELVEA